MSDETCAHGTSLKNQCDDCDHELDRIGRGAQTKRMEIEPRNDGHRCDKNCGAYGCPSDYCAPRAATFVVTQEQRGEVIGALVDLITSASVSRPDDEKALWLVVAALRIKSGELSGHGLAFGHARAFSFMAGKDRKPWLEDTLF